jgi:hypothetical protein
MLRLLVALLPTLLSAMRSRRDLVLENVAIRQDGDTVVRGREQVDAGTGEAGPYWAASR